MLFLGGHPDRSKPKPSPRGVEIPRRGTSLKRMRPFTRRTLLKGMFAAPFLGGCATLGRPAAPALVDPALGPGAGWTIALFPDTQNYAKYAKNQANFDLMTRWVVEHRAAWNIQLVMHEGDFVEQNDIAVGGGRGFGDQDSASQWRSAKRALGVFDGVLPTVFATGNHDYGERSAESRATRFNDYFPLTHNPLTCDGRGGGIFLEGPPTRDGQPTLENAAYAFRAPDGRDLLVVALEWGPRRFAVEWARELLARPRFRDHFGILLVHDFLLPNNLRDGQAGERTRPGNPHWYKTGAGGDTHDGEDLWRALVRRSPNLRLVLNGHEMGAHVGYRQDDNDAGRPVHQMLFNAQGLGGGSDHRGNGGDGWLRLLTFEPDGRTLAVRTFSPLRRQQGLAAYWDDPRWRFALDLRG
jgi:hypothetical protein